MCACVCVCVFATAASQLCNGKWGKILKIQLLQSPPREKTHHQLLYLPARQCQSCFLNSCIRILWHELAENADSWIPSPELATSWLGMEFLDKNKFSCEVKFKTKGIGWLDPTGWLFAGYHFNEVCLNVLHWKLHECESNWVWVQEWSIKIFQIKEVLWQHSASFQTQALVERAFIHESNYSSFISPRFMRSKVYQ